MSTTQAFLDTLRPEILTLPEYNSGLSIEYVRAKYNVDKIAKLGSNENPFGASTQVAAALYAAVSDSALYPLPFCDDLRAAVSSHLGVEPERLIFGNGSEDLISVAAHTFLSPGDDFITMIPSFGLHVIYPQGLGAKVRGIEVRSDYSLDMEEVLRALGPRTRMVILSNPSNPVSTSITKTDMVRLLDTLPTDVLLVFDEAYYEYAAADPSYPDFRQMLEEADRPWILLRTFSKAYGLAGLRVGYGVSSHSSLMDLMNRTRTPFNVNRLAQVAAVAALRDQDHMMDCVARTLKERAWLSAGLDDLQYGYAPSRSNFLFFDARENAAALAARLLSFGVIVKPWHEPGYQEHIRVSVGTRQSNEQFLSALKATARPE